MEDFKISQVITHSIEVMKKCFGGTDVKLLSSEMYRETASQEGIGRLGVNIEIEGVKTFLSYTDFAESICGPMGNLVAEEFVFMVLKESGKFRDMLREQHIKNMAEIFAANIAEFEVGDLVKETNGIVSKITNKSINSIEVEIDKLPLKKNASKENIGIKARQWFTMENFNRRFKK